jgi:capsular exopolysaccharide synthesis family protein
MSDNDKIIRYDGQDPHLAPYELYMPPGQFGFPHFPRKHLREYVRLVWKRKWVVLAVVITALAMSAVYTFRQIPQYQATAKLEIDPQTANVLPYQDFSRTDDSGYMYQEFLQTKIKVITSRTLARLVAQAAGLDREIPSQPKPEERKSEFASLWARITGADGATQEQKPLTPEEKLEQATDKVMGGLSVSSVRNSRIVELTYTSPDPALAARIVNTLANQYIEYNIQQSWDTTTQAGEQLQKRLVDLKANVEEAESKLVEYARTHNIVEIGEKSNVAFQNLAEMNSKLNSAKGERMDKESVYKTVGNATPDNFPQALRTQQIEALEAKLHSDEQELARNSVQLGPGMYQVKQLESTVKKGKEQLRSQMQLAIDNARTVYQTALAHEELLRKDVQQQNKVANELKQSSIQYDSLRRDLEAGKTILESVQQRVKEAGVAAGLRSTNVQIVDKAEVPKYPYSPDLRRNLVLALMLGLAGGLGFAMFLNYLDNNVKTPEDVEEMLGLPALGLIPSLKSARGRYGYLAGKGRQKANANALAKQGVELASLVAGSSLIAEAYRGLRTALLLSTPENPPKTIMVTSARAQEGKTTTVCNTALSLAQTGKKVLILDCDMRRPKIRKIFQMNGSGLSEYLTGQIDFSKVVQETTIPNLFLAHSGTIPPNPGELLGSAKMQEAITAATAMFDFVLIDTPPMMSVADPLIVAPMTDGVILVTKGGKNQPEVLRKAKKNLELVRARILGVLCNNVNLRSSDYHYYYHQYLDYDSYVSHEDKKRPGMQ